MANVEKVIVGKRRQIVLSLVAWFSEGHILLEDVPSGEDHARSGIGPQRGLLAEADPVYADLLPTDVTGSSVFNQKTADFEFRPGPIFAQLVLADEINRTTPRTQAALLEAMAEAG